ncbi:MAG: signal transduction histidine kinase [Hyphomicrobiaceae bacterium]|jgi:signal transduction histidine kinase
MIPQTPELEPDQDLDNFRAVLADEILSGLRWVLRVTFYALMLFIVADELFLGGLGAPVRWLQILLAIWVAGGIVLAPSSFAAQRPRFFAGICIVGVYVMAGLISTSSGDKDVPVIMFVALSVGAASFIPWGPVTQLVTVVAAQALVLYNAFIVSGGVTKAHAYPAIASMTVTLAASVIIARRVETEREETHKIRVHRETAETERRKAQEQLRLAHDQLETRVTDRTAALSASNRALESFTYSVSHDLRGPLRLISADAWDLVQDRVDTLSPADRATAEHISTTAHRMDEIIKGLLKVSRLSRVDLQRTHIDLSALAETNAAYVAEQYPDHSMKVVIEPGLTAEGDPGLVGTMLTNLFANAWKFTERVHTPEVFFRRESVGPPQAFSVSDNGAGFDPSQAEKVFTPFLRLHTDLEFEGTGIGLATVERIAKRHGGKVWADGEIDCGATFYFTLENDPGRSQDTGAKPESHL